MGQQSRSRGGEGRGRRRGLTGRDDAKTACGKGRDQLQAEAAKKKEEEKKAGSSVLQASRGKRKQA